MASQKIFGLAFLLYRYCSWLERWSVVLFILSLFVVVVGTGYSFLLYKNLRTDMEELLPQNADSVKDLKRVQGRVSGFNHLSIVIETNDKLAGRLFQKDLVTKLRELPPTLVAQVKDHIREEQDFFKKNRSLYIDFGDWELIRKYIKARIRQERKKEAILDPTLVLDFDSLQQKHESRVSALNRFPDGIFESQDGKTHIVLVFLPGRATDILSNKNLSRAAHNIVQRLQPQSYAPDLVVGFAGDVQNVVEEHESLMEDLIKSSVIVALLVSLSLYLYFRNGVGVLALCWALYVGIATTFGLSYFLVGYLNANSAFLGSIIVGNGINFGIIMLSRYFEERRKGLKRHIALPRCIGYTAQATWVAALAAGLAYLSLVLTDFRGFNQFGLIGGIGMVLCWLSTFVMLPVLLILFERWHWLHLPRMASQKFWSFRILARFVTTYHRSITLVTLLLTIVSCILVSQFSSDTIETDFQKLRSRWSLLTGSGYWGKKVDAVFERYLTPTIVLASEAKDTQKIAKALEDLRAQEGENSPISEIRQLEDFLPQDQTRKIKVISEIQQMLPESTISKLNKKEKILIDQFVPRGKMQFLTVQDLPHSMQSPFRELDGNLNTMLHIYPRVDEKTASFWDGKQVIRFSEKIRKGIRNAAVPAAIAGQPPLSADMVSSIAEDGPKATVFAFIAVMALVVLIFPRWQLVRSILAALLLGVLWMGAVMILFELKINFLNFIALPITFGIGVDYAVNIFSRYQFDRSHSIRKVIENTGGAVALCSLTTIIGYSSLLLASSQAFVSFGTLAVLGEMTCLLAALVAMPAMWHWFGSGVKSP